MGEIIVNEPVAQIGRAGKKVNVGSIADLVVGDELILRCSTNTERIKLVHGEEQQVREDCGKYNHIYQGKEDGEYKHVFICNGCQTKNEYTPEFLQQCLEQYNQIPKRKT